MRDIVERLELQAFVAEKIQSGMKPLIMDCLDEITRLRAEKEKLREKISELDAEVRYAYLECEDLIKNYHWEDDVFGDASCLVENMRQCIKSLRDIAITNERYKRIDADNSAWKRMLAAREKLECK